MLVSRQSSPGVIHKHALFSFPELHSVHPAVYIRPADMDGQPLHIRLRLLQRWSHRQVLQAVRPAEGAGAGGEALNTLGGGGGRGGGGLLAWSCGFVSLGGAGSECSGQGGGVQDKELGKDSGQALGLNFTSRFTQCHF